MHNGSLIGGDGTHFDLSGRFMSNYWFPYCLGERVMDKLRCLPCRAGTIQYPFIESEQDIDVANEIIKRLLYCDECPRYPSCKYGCTWTSVAQL